MSRRSKLIDAVLNNPKDVRFEDACKIAEWLGFTHRSGRGSHRVYVKAGECVSLNFQDRGGRVPPYQARQLIEMIEKYKGES